MKKSRIWLILLIAVILPFKGAMAAAGMFCHLGTGQIAEAAQAAQHHAVVDQAQTTEPHHDAAHAGGSSTDGSPTQASSSCAICSAFCSSPPLPAAGIQAVPPGASAAERFPPLAVPRSSTVVSGLERPPRTV
jgi:hypothetical protein